MSFQSKIVRGSEDTAQGEDFSWNNHGDIIREIGPEQKYTTFINDAGKEVKISLIDLRDIGNLSDDEISEMLLSILGITIQSNKGIAQVNNLAQKAYSYLKKELLYTEKELKSIGNIKFHNSQEIIKFFKGTKYSQGIQKCMLAKVGMLYQDGVSSSVEEKRQKTLDVLDKKVILNLEDLTKNSALRLEEKSITDEFKDTGKANFTGSSFVENDTGVIRKIEFTVEIREKSIESTISKALREKDYINQGDIMDLLGIRITTKNKEDKLILMHRLSQLAFKYGEYRIKNKGGVSKSDLNTILTESEFFTQNASSAAFIQKLEMTFGNVEKRVSTALKYSDIKLVPVGDGNKLSFEILFLDEGHTNDVGLAHHKPFSYIRKIEERVRLEGFITHDGLKTIAEAMVDDLASSKKDTLGGLNPTEIIKEILKDVYDELTEKRNEFGLKGSEAIDAMKKQELIYELKRVIPLYYASRLFVFKDTQGNISARKKYTTKIGRENFSILSLIQK